MHPAAIIDMLVADTWMLMLGSWREQVHVVALLQINGVLFALSRQGDMTLIPLGGAVPTPAFSSGEHVWRCSARRS